MIIIVTASTATVADAQEALKPSRDEHFIDSVWKPHAQITIELEDRERSPVSAAHIMLYTGKKVDISIRPMNG